MSVILVVMLYSGTVFTQEFQTESACKEALLTTIDQQLPKNIESIECEVGE